MGPPHETGPAGRVRPLRVFWMVMGAAALLLASVHAYYESLTPAPYDLSVLGQSDWRPDAPAALHVRLLTRTGGEPVPDVPVEIELAGSTPERRERLATLRTGRDGSASPRFRIPDGPDGRYDLRVTVEVRTYTLPRFRVDLELNRPDYQPGEVVRGRLHDNRPDMG